MSRLPHAVGLCRARALVALSDGSWAEFTDYLNEDMEPVYEHGPDHTPEDALYVAYDLGGRRCATDICNVKPMSLH